jgi:hypothetical protein
MQEGAAPKMIFGTTDGQKNLQACLGPQGFRSLPGGNPGRRSTSKGLALLANMSRDQSPRARRISHSVAPYAASCESGNQKWGGTQMVSLWKRLGRTKVLVVAGKTTTHSLSLPTWAEAF